MSILKSTEVAEQPLKKSVAAMMSVCVCVGGCLHIFSLHMGVIRA